MKSDKVLRKYYRIINKKFFNNELPDNVCVRFADEDDVDGPYDEPCADLYFGWADHGEGRHIYQIAISKTKNPAITAVLATLCHEMCHIFTALKDDHGPAFEAARQMIADRGVFKKNAVLRGLTLF